MDCYRPEASTEFKITDSKPFFPEMEMVSSTNAEYVTHVVNQNIGGEILNSGPPSSAIETIPALFVCAPKPE